MKKGIITLTALCSLGVLLSGTGTSAVPTATIHAARTASHHFSKQQYALLAYLKYSQQKPADLLANVANFSFSNNGNTYTMGTNGTTVNVKVSANQVTVTDQQQSHHTYQKARLAHQYAADKATLKKILASTSGTTQAAENSTSQAATQKNTATGEGNSGNGQSGDPDTVTIAGHTFHKSYSNGGLHYEGDNNEGELGEWGASNPDPNIKSAYDNFSDSLDNNN